MMERLFLLSELPAGHGQQVLHSITQQFQPVLVLTKEIEGLPRLIQQYPDVTWVVVDIGRDADWLSSFLEVIPAPNYIVNFSGSDFAHLALDSLRKSGHEYTERERGRSELTFFGGLVKSSDSVSCTIFINVVEKRSTLEKKSKGVTKAVGKLVKGAKSTLSNLIEDSDSAEENSPLLQGNNECLVPEEPSCFRSLLSCFCPCIFGPPEVQYQFRTPEELHAYLRTEETRELQKCLKKLHEKLNQSLATSLSELRRKEEQKLGELNGKVEAMKEEEGRKLGDVADQQNKNTRTNLLSTLGEETVKRIEQSRSRQTKGKIDCDADRVLKEGKELIRKQVQIDRAQLMQSHYENLLLEQLRKLNDIHKKYQQKKTNLLQRYFGNFVRT